MAFTKSYITQQGLALVSKLVSRKQELEISAVVGGKSADPGIDPSDMDAIADSAIVFQTNEGVVYIAPNRIQIPLYYENSAQTAPVKLTEIALFAKEPDSGGELLLAIATSYDDPLPLPTLDEGRLELSTDFILELSLTPDITISLPSSVIYLTRPEAMQLFWIIGEKYAATEIVESVGSSTEEHQRWQDEELKRIWSVLESGSTAGTLFEKPVKGVAPYNWRILNNSGYRDKATGTIRA